MFFQLPFSLSESPLACNSLQSGSSSRMTWKYDVFVSFRGEDTRNNITNHLFGALHKKGIVTFRDDTELKKGEHISFELLQAIEGSHILIVIFSRNYASSTWCLQELTKIADCIDVPGQSVLPIFYDVSPSEVRKQSGDYEKAFLEHEERFKANLEEVQRWRRALTQVANLSGWDIRDKPQYAEIGEIIKVVTCLLGNKSSNLSSDIVGMHSRVEELENLLMLDSNDDVRAVGICGMGGIGKTTLATALYARISNQFDSCCFIDDVSKIYGDHGPIGVQKQLLCQTLNEENLQICNLPMASNLIRTRLRQIKSLVVLDNVDEGDQLDKLGLKRGLGTGSRIIIVSSNGHVFREHGVDEVYRVRLLDPNNALQLFCRNAFKSDAIMSGFKYLTYKVLAYARGHPLAIKVLGSFLSGLDASEWSSALARLKESPRKDIMNVLRISFDGLEDTEKDIFLDIACFFHRYPEAYVKKILDFRGFYPEIGLRVLTDKSFITRERHMISMHDLFRELGKSIVREKSPREPRKWNRVWDYKDIHNVISENMAIENLEAIVMKYDPENDEEIQKMSTLRAEALAQMSRLKLLKLLKFNFSGSLNFLSSELGYLNWDKYPFTSLPSSFQPDKLVELILRDSNIRKLWEGTKSLPNLTRIDLSHSKNLIMMPNYKEIPNLESLQLQGCIKLVKIDPSIGTLRRLSTLSLENCTNLVSIPNNIFGLSSLKYLNLSGCPNLFNNKLLEIQRQIEQLGMLDNKKSTTQDQPTSFIYKFLEPHLRFFIRKPEDSVGLLLPSLSHLSCLQYLDLSFCNLLQIPNVIGMLHCLETLYLGGNNFVTLPSSIKELSKLRRLNLQHCKQLKYLPELPSKNVLRVRTTTYFNSAAEFNIFDCPSLIEMECCYRMAFSWMIQLLQVHMQSDVPIGHIRIVIPKTQIPKWFNKQNVGSSISIDPSPIMHDKNFIGVACCVTFVAHDNPTNLSEERSPRIGIGFQSKWRGNYSTIPIRLGKDLITVDLDHLLLVFFNREKFIDCYISDLSEDGLHDISVIELSALVMQPLGLHLEVKNCGYRWIFKEDLEQLNPEMMYSGSSSIQPYY